MLLEWLALAGGCRCGRNLCLRRRPAVGRDARAIRQARRDLHQCGVNGAKGGAVDLRAGANRAVRVGLYDEKLVVLLQVVLRGPECEGPGRGQRRRREVLTQWRPGGRVHLVVGLLPDERAAAVDLGQPGHETPVLRWGGIAGEKVAAVAGLVQRVHAAADVRAGRAVAAGAVDAAGVGPLPVDRAARSELDQQCALTALAVARGAGVPVAADRVAAVDGLHDRVYVLDRCDTVGADVVEPVLPGEVAGGVELRDQHGHQRQAGARVRAVVKLAGGHIAAIGGRRDGVEVRVAGRGGAELLLPLDVAGPVQLHDQRARSLARVGRTADRNETAVTGRSELIERGSVDVCEICPGPDKMTGAAELLDQSALHAVPARTYRARATAGRAARQHIAAVARRLQRDRVGVV